MNRMNNDVTAVSLLKAMISKQEKISDEYVKSLQESAAAFSRLVSSHDYDRIAEDTNELDKTIHDNMEGFRASEIRLNELKNLLNELTAAEADLQKNAAGIA